MKVGQRYKDLWDTEWGFRINSITNEELRVQWYKGIRLMLDFNDYYKQIK